MGLGPNPTVTKTVNAGSAITRYRLLKYSAEDTLVHAVDGAAAIVGVARQAAASGDRLDVDMGGIVEVEFGGTVSAGGPVTADANGKAVASAPAAGVNSWIFGLAASDAVAGDIATVDVSKGRIQG